MLGTLISIPSLLLGIGVLLMGLGLLGTVLGVRAALEDFPDAVTGVVMAAYFVGYILGTYLCPTIIRRVGHIRAYAALAAVASVSAFAHSLVIHPLAWVPLRIVSGLCLVGLYMVIESWLNSQAPNARRGKILATYMTVTLLALGLGQYLILLDPSADFPAFGIAAAFICLGLVPVALTAVPEPNPVKTPELGLRHLFAISPLGVIGALAAGLTTSAFWGMGAVFAQRIGLNSTGIALFMSATIFGGVLLQWPIGHLSDFKDRRVVLTVTALVTAVLALTTFFASQSPDLWLYPSAFLLGGFVFSLYGLSVAHLNDHVSPSEVLEASRGVLLVFGGGAVFGPVAAGVLMQGTGPRSLFVYMASVPALLVLFALARMRISSPIPAEAQRTFVPMVRTSQAALEMVQIADAQPDTVHSELEP